MEDRIQIDEPSLRHHVLSYLNSPNGKRVLFQFEFHLLESILACGVAAVFGLCLLPTIVWTRDGLKILWNVLKLKAFENKARDVGGNPEKLFPLIAHGIIIGPSRRHALVLGSFRSPREYSADRLAQKASFLAQVYLDQGDGQSSQHAALKKLLRDDVFRRNRRRRLPEPYAEGEPLLLFDADLFVYDEASEGGPDKDTPFETVLLSFVANYGDERAKGELGELHAIPWRAVSDAVKIA